MVMLSAGNWVQAAVCEIVNGSFEDDGWIDDVAKTEPNGWNVNMLADKFHGYVYTDWPTDANSRYNLTLYSEWFTTFAAADLATVSQDIYLADVNEIIFDLKLETFGFTQWDPNICTAILLIDDDVVWESNDVGSDVRGEYLDQSYMIEDKYKYEGPHKLSLGIRVNVDGMLFERYITHWDSIDCTSFSDGGDFLPGDLNRDYYVDMSDLNLVVDAWLDKVPLDHTYNLFRGDDVVVGYGTINFLDFAVFAGNWENNISNLEMLTEKWLDEVDPNDQYNLFASDNVAPGGIINFFEFAILADNWMGSSYEQE